MFSKVDEPYAKLSWTTNEPYYYKNNLPLQENLLLQETLQFKENLPLHENLPTTWKSSTSLSVWTIENSEWKVCTL